MKHVFAGVLMFTLALLTVVLLASFLAGRASAQSKTADHLTSFCSVTWDVPPPTESMKRTFALEPKEWAALVDWINRIMQKRREECRES